jgi:hypothetical protein
MRLVLLLVVIVVVFRFYAVWNGDDGPESHESGRLTTRP